MRLMILVLLVALTALVVACGQANEAEEPTGGGIQVHGHWTVTVTDPDGTVARVHEFDNALDSANGSALLTALLHGTNNVVLHHIRVYRPGGAWYCAEAAGKGDYSPEGIAVGKAAAKAAASNRIPALATRELDKTNTPLMLSGVCTVTDTDGPGPMNSISKVSSLFQLSSPVTYCYNAGAVMNKCHTTMNPLRLTGHVETIPVANNQIVAFNIVFSFE